MLGGHITIARLANSRMRPRNVRVQYMYEEKIVHLDLMYVDLHKILLWSRWSRCTLSQYGRHDLGTTDVHGKKLGDWGGLVTILSNKTSTGCMFHLTTTCTSWPSAVQHLVWIIAKTCGLYINVRLHTCTYYACSGSFTLVSQARPSYEKNRERVWWITLHVVVPAECA